MSAGNNAGSDVGDGSFTGSSEAVLRVDALDTVGGVDVLNEGELPASGTALAGGNGRVGKEVLPDLRRR